MISVMDLRAISLLTIYPLARYATLSLSVSSMCVCVCVENLIFRASGVHSNNTGAYRVMSGNQ